LQFSSLGDSLRCIEPQQSYRRRADLSRRFHQGAIEPEMIRPPVFSGMEQPDNFSRMPVDGGNIRPFVPIAEPAGIG
jgi:hypothetical protein